jgi:gamma-glutamylcyclotransferase
MNPSTVNTNPTLYFAYGSNLWLHQMHIRCPTAQYIGLAKLVGYKWIISERGYANVVEVASDADSNSSSYENVVYGMVYTLQEDDEAKLDKNEGVPVAYTKEYLECTFWTHTPGPVNPAHPEDIKRIDTTGEPTDERKLLVYIDRKRVQEGVSREEYVVRMNSGIKDAEMCGVTEGYVREVLRRFIPVGEGEGMGDGKGKKSREVEELAKRQAGGFRDESGVF